MSLSRPEFQWLPVASLKPDITNPRIAKWLEMYGDDVSPEAIRLALGLGVSNTQQTDSGTTYGSLKESIRTHGGLIQPIIVNKISDDEYVVIEGNTRVVIIQEFLENGVKGSWEYVPARVHYNLSKGDIDAIRLQAHLVGPRAWDPYSKAKYLVNLREQENLTIDQIIDFCGQKRREVQTYIDAYNDMEKYYRQICEDEQTFDHRNFSAFVELQYPKRQEALLTSGYTKRDFAAWVKDLKFKPLETIRQLPKILNDKKSRETFIKYDAREAIKVLDLPSAEVSLKDANLEQLAREICKRTSELRWPELKELRSSLDEIDILFEARDELTELCNDISEQD